MNDEITNLDVNESPVQTAIKKDVKDTRPLYVISPVTAIELEKHDIEGYRVIPGTIFRDGSLERVIMRLA